MIWKWIRENGVDRAADAARPSVPGGSKHINPVIGRTDAACPYCERTLSKRPSRKARCPHCDNFIYVRTRPNDRKRVLVTEAEAAQIVAQWELARETPSLESFKERNADEKGAFERERAALAAKFGGPPSDRDVRWSLLNKQLIEHSSEGNWGLYRNARLDMADILHADGRLEAALLTYLEVCYLDLNGPRNTGATSSLRVLEKYPPFSPSESFIASGVMRRADSILKKLTLDRAAVHSLFLGHVQQHCTHLDLPLPPERAWPRIEMDLFDSTY